MVTVHVDWALCRVAPFEHQKIGVKTIITHPMFLLADEMGAGKTKQAIDAAQFLFRAGIIDKVLIIAPAAVRNVWYDPELGEIAKHAWTHQAGRVLEYHAKVRGWIYGPDGQQRRLEWMITNYEFIRSQNRLAQLLPFAGPKTLLILDESSAVKNHRAQQTKSCLVLRRRCQRVLLLNGTPIANSPLDMYSQGQLMSPNILSCASYFHFRSRYAVMGGFQQKQITGWTNLEDMQRRFAPYVLRRLKKDCLDLPPKLPSIILNAALTPETWNVYKEMRDEMLAWLDNNTVSTAPQAIVKAIRLAQITSGFLGGISDQSALGLGEDPDTTDTRPDWLPLGQAEDTQLTSKIQSYGRQGVMGTVEIGQEKLDLVMDWIRERLEEDKNFKLLIWCRFRPEVFRLGAQIMRDLPRVHFGMIIGGQKRTDQEAAKRLLDSRTAPAGPAIVVGTPQTGRFGLTMTATHHVMYLSNDYSLMTRQQSEDRVHRPGQKYPVSYYDVVATGPNGQKTIDHAIIRALRNKDDVAQWTTAAWIKALREE